MAFATKEYEQNQRRLAVVKFNGSKYQFDIHDGAVTMMKGLKVVGSVEVSNGLSVHLNGNHLHIDAQTTSELIPLTVNNEQKLSIISTDENNGLPGRLLHKISQYSIEESELIILSVAFALADKQI